MAERPSRRFYLADLVAAVLICGTVAAMFSSGRVFAESPGYSFIIIFVIINWGALRSWKTSPTCDECGRRFAPPRKPAPVIECPHCGERQWKFARSLKRRKILFWAMPPLITLSAVATIILSTEAWIVGESLEGPRFASVVIAASAGLMSALTMVRVGANRSRLAQPKDRPCEACGQLIPKGPPVPMLCPICLTRQRSIDQLEKDQAKAARTGWFMLAIVGGIGAVLAWANFYSAVHDLDNQKVLIPYLAGLFVVFLLFGSFVVWVIRASTRVRWLMSEDATLMKARACAGEDGTVVSEGTATIWYSGPKDPCPMLREEIAAARGASRP